MLAARMHKGQTDKAGQPYILHLIRVMLRMEDDDSRIVAVLHDLVEDTSVTLDDLRAAGYSERVLAAVDALTRRTGEEYAAFIERVAHDPVARLVKLADLTDNMNLNRLPGVSDADRERVRKYQVAWERLNSG
ncbi:MAG: HD domain-containing protein [Acidobacteria bacterium]|nr:HD domain-containing protein [Acidobacteriota bacterium]